MLLQRIKVWIGKPLAGRPHHKAQVGMTIIEILIVIALMGTIMTLVITNVLDVGEGAKRDAAVLGMQKMQSSLDMYRIHNYRYPSTEQGLNALVTQPADSKRWRGPYTDEKQLQDPWGYQYEYQSDGRNFKIISPGPDGVVGNSDDIVYPEESGNESAGGE